ncbi:MAG: 2-oxoacid:acceptor oxidoreductase family protein, partial [Candidatus Neomarinimicrobiota bacterium]
EMGNRIFANVIMVGFLIAITKVVSLESMKKALPGTVPDRFLPNNIDALEKGYDFGLGLIKKKKTIGPVQKPEVELRSD